MRTAPFGSRSFRAAVWMLLGALLSTGGLRGGNRNAFPLPEERGAAGILASLEKLPVFVRVLHTTAHPDDESSATLTWLARRAHARTALLSLTRGDGGQNILGGEKYEAMGLVRTGELLEACRIYGVETFFTTVFEFGFSKSAEETLSKWGREATLEEVVRFIRTWRPTIIISKWQGSTRDGHGHHQAAGLITHEAFRAAGDPNRFPEHFKAGLYPWQAKKLYRNNVRGDSDARFGSAPGLAGGQADPDWTTRVNVGEFDPVLGRTYREIGSEGYSKHRSQGNGASYSLGGRTYDYYKLVDSTVPKQDREESFFDGIDMSLMSIAKLVGGDSSLEEKLHVPLAEAYSAAESSLRAFNARRPAASALGAAQGARILWRMVQQFGTLDLPAALKRALLDALEEKQRDFQEAVNACLGIYMVARSDDPTATPGQNVPITVYFFNRGSEPVELKRVTLWTPEGWVASQPAGAPLGRIAPGESVQHRFTVEIPSTAQPTEPFWYRKNPEDSRYVTRPTRNPFAPFDRPEIQAQATYLYQGVEIPIFQPVLAQVSDPLRGVDFRDFQIVPALSVELSPEAAIVPLSARELTRDFQVSIRNSRSGASRGIVELRAPEGWRAVPARTEFEFTRKDEVFNARFSVRVPADTRPGSFAVEAVARSGDQEYRRGYRVVSYPENWTRHLYSPSRAGVKIFDVKISPNLTVGYVPGAGDEVPQSLQQLGVQVQILSGADLASADLRRFSTIVTGIRAYNVNEELKGNNQRLLRYVEEGGTLIVQYNMPLRSGSGQFPYGPFAMSYALGERITVEDSPLRMLAPESPVFNSPNKITEADFNGWVQERGLCFATQWDSQYTPLLSGNDPGEQPKNGGMLVAKYGKGHYIFTAYAWFRQLPAGVPGAYRIFANLLSFGK